MGNLCEIGFQKPFIRCYHVKTVSCQNRTGHPVLFFKKQNIEFHVMNGSFCTFVDSRSIQGSDEHLPLKKRSRKSVGHKFKAPTVKNHKELDSEISLFYCGNSSCEQERGTLDNTCIIFSTKLLHETLFRWMLQENFHHLKFSAV